MGKTYKDRYHEKTPRVYVKKSDTLDERWERAQGHPAPFVDPVYDTFGKESELTCPVCGFRGRGFLYIISTGKITIVCPHRRCQFALYE